ncbi:uncharacterized protein KGF55_005163 [Candida pseudojiufengensis]|uniref:uncharacterized protein n=1 Tax=Candida pseudojiufengensis TaxID=497109 RepID=UPI0022253E9E|nr:uncharacterized protein KGF55_005163 [Candida pseudojiufengensis]KAI5959931.1 hypothetical protein KGF55_005163 [Candida pseudojiufengensis]
MSTATAAPSKTYKEMITEAIITLKERNGSSRQSLKKYVQSNNDVKANFESNFNSALRKGVTNGDFIQPKGPSGPVKLNKEKIASEKKPTTKKVTKPTTEAKPKSTKAAATTTKKSTTSKSKKATAAATADAEAEAPAAKKVTKKAAPKKAAPKKVTKKAAAKPKK